jgi:hypothetical protein
MIIFFEWEGVKPPEEKDCGYPVKGKFGFDHISFGVESEDTFTS